MDEKVKTINELIEYLNSKGIEVKEDDKQDLINYGYFHGYKGYRFFKDPCNLLPITNYKQIKALIKLDNNLKSLLYGKVMFIETSLKNITLNIIIEKTKTKNVNDLYTLLANENLKNAYPPNNEQKENIKENIIKLKTKIITKILSEYKNRNVKITHFYKNIDISSVPLWAIFEILSLGDFAFLLKTLNYELRDEISKELNITKSFDTTRVLLVDYIYLLKDLRNAIAHNLIIYDCRFKTTQISNSMRKCLMMLFEASSINFSNIFDYALLIIFFLKQLKMSNKEIINFIESFDYFINEFRNSIPIEIYSYLINKNYQYKINAAKKYVEKN